MEISVAAQRPVQNGYTQELSKAQEAKNREQEPAREASEDKPAGVPRYDTFERTPSVGALPKGGPENQERCTVNTDKVDSEIKQLKERRQQIQQELSKAEEGERAALEQQLSRLDAELKTKDNDTYRKQHAVVTYG